MLRPVLGLNVPPACFWAGAFLFVVRHSLPPRAVIPSEVPRALPFPLALTKEGRCVRARDAARDLLLSPLEV